MLERIQRESTICKIWTICSCAPGVLCTLWAWGRCRYG